MQENPPHHLATLPLPQGGMVIDKVNVSPAEVIQLLDNIITDERQNRIESIINHRTNNFIPVIENIYDRGNINAVMRSAEAFGFYNFHIVEQEKANFKESNRITQGTHKWLNISRHNNSTSAVKALRAQGVKVYCTHLEASKPMSEIDFTLPTALVFGNESDGVSEEMTELADGNCIIPMQGFAQSFNISVAAAISFYHVFTRREAKYGCSGDLSDKNKEWLKANYFLKTFGSTDKFIKMYKQIKKQNKI